MDSDTFHYARLYKAPSNLTLQWKGYSQLLDSLFQCPATLIANNFFLTSYLNLCSFSLYLLPLVLSPYALVKCLSPSYKTLLCIERWQEEKPSLLQAKQSQLSQPFFAGDVFSRLIFFAALLWTHSNMFLSFLCRKAPELDVVLQVGFHKGRLDVGESPVLN